MDRGKGMKRALRIAVAVAAAALALAPDARASFTPSEQAQVRAFVAGGQIQNAPRVRAMTARTDLTPEESAQSLKDATAQVPFDDAHAAFFRDVLFGGASAASRPVLVPAVTRALLARADMVLSKFATDLDQQPRAQDELARIYRFLEVDVAGAGQPKGIAHDPQMGIPPAAYDECAKAMALHVEQNARWLKGNAPIPAPVVRIRGQLQLALLDMLNDTLTRRVEAADKLGIGGARRKLLLETGIVLVDSGRGDDGRVVRVRGLVDRLLLAKSGVSALVFGDDAPRLAARAAVLGVKTPLEGSGTAVPWPFSEEVEPGPADAATQEIARDLGALAARRALENRPELRLVAERDLKAAAASPYGRPDGGASTASPATPAVGPKTQVNTEATTEAGLAAALELLLTDAPRAFDLAFVRVLANKPESAAVMSDALGVLATFATPDAEKKTLAITLGKPRGVDGTLAPVELTNVRLAPSGAVTGFTVDGHAWTLVRDAGPVTQVRRDSVPLNMSFLGQARVPALEATSWSVPGLVLARMHGTPKAGVAPGPKVRMVGAGEPGYDAIATLAPADNLVVEGDLTVTGQVGGIALRAAGTKDGFRGAALLITPWPSPRIALVLREEDGFESFLAAPRDVAEVGTMHVRLTVKGTKVEAKAGDIVLKGTIPTSFARGDVAIVAKKGAIVDLAAFTAKR